MTDLPAGDPTTLQFWRAALEGALILQSCAKCGSVQFYPRPFCLECQAADLVWKESSGRGFVYAATTVRIPVLPRLKPPYRVGLIDLIEGPRFLGHLANEEIRIGDAVSLVWTTIPGTNRPLPVFRLGAS